MAPPCTGNRHPVDRRRHVGIDFALWSYSIQLIGAGIASVVVNIQVVIVPMLTWVAFGTRVPIRFVIAVPVLLGGIALSSGAFVEGGGDSVIAGTGLRSVQDLPRQFTCSQPGEQVVLGDRHRKYSYPLLRLESPAAPSDPSGEPLI